MKRPNHLAALLRLTAMTAVALVALSPRMARAQFTIADGGHARCVIVSQAGATVAERHAAEELAATLGAMTGATFPIVDALPAKGAAIVVGPGAAADARFGAIDEGALGTDERIERMRGETLWLTGT